MTWSYSQTIMCALNAHEDNHLSLLHFWKLCLLTAGSFCAPPGFSAVTVNTQSCLWADWFTQHTQLQLDSMLAALIRPAAGPTNWHRIQRYIFVHTALGISLIVSLICQDVEKPAILSSFRLIWQRHSYLNTQKLQNIVRLESCVHTPDVLYTVSSLSVSSGFNILLVHYVHSFNCVCR